ncbi:hypothetical protein EMCRGX_G008884 [Ephydatia muelleri]
MVVMVACSPYHWLIAVHLIISSSTHAQPSGSSPRTEGEGLCPSSIAGDLVSCDSQTGDWLVRNTNWFGMIDNTLVVVNCPPNYCFYNTSSPYVRIPQNISSDPAEVLCYPEGRRGYICGQCLQGWAPAVNSDPVVCVRCEDDTRGWLYYLLAIYVPVFAFFMFIVVFNVRFTTGPLNAFILYAQLISTTFNQLYKPIDDYQRAYRTLYGDLDSLNVIALKYLEAVFPLFTIVGIVVFLRCKGFFRCCCCVPCRDRWVGSGRVATSLVHAFAAFILLSYTRFCLVTTYVLTPIPLWNIAMETVGDRPYFAGQHRFSELSYILPNVIPACIVLVTFIAIPPILLLDYPMRWIESAIFKSPALTRWYPKVGIGIVLDAFQGCFHDDKRYFAGLYFTLRLLLFMTYFAPLILQYVLQQVLVTVFAVFLSVQRPYKMHSLNFLDSLLLLNMAVINILGIYSLATDQLTPSASSSSTLTSVFAIQYVLIWLPVVYVMVYLCRRSKIARDFVHRSRGHFHLKEASTMELRGRTKLSASAVEGRDRESEVERSDTSTLYVLIDLDHPPK